MKGKQIGFTAAAMMAVVGVARAAMVCVTDTKLTNMVLDVVAAGDSFCSSSSGSRTGGSGQYCWCKVSGTWSYKNNHYLSTICLNTCRAYCEDNAVKRSYCAGNNSGPITNEGGYCWCFASGSWSLNGGIGDDCPSSCKSRCNVS